MNLTFTHVRIAGLANQLRETRATLDTLAAGDAAADVRAVFWSSYRALNPTDARLFRLLGLHPGPDISAAASAALVGVAPAQVHGMLDGLMRAHLVAEHRPGRYTSHDLLRAFAAERAETEETEAGRHSARHRMLDHYLRTAELADELLYPHRDRVELPVPSPGVEAVALLKAGDAIAWFAAEEPVLVALGPDAIAAGFEPYSWHLLYALVNLLDQLNQWRAFVPAQQDALEAARRLGDLRGQAMAHRGLCRAACQLRRLDDLLVHAHRAMQLYRELGDPGGEAQCLLLFAVGHCILGNPRDALPYTEQGIGVYRAAGHCAGEANALNNLGWILAQLGEYERALGHCEEALALQRQLDDRPMEALTLDSLGFVHHKLGQLDQAADCYREALCILGQVEAPFRLAETLVHLGDLHEDRGEMLDACGAWRSALEIYEDADDPEACSVRARLDRVKGTP